MIQTQDVTEAGFKNYNLATFSWFLTNICQYRCSYCSVANMLEKTFESQYRYAYKNVLKRLSLKRIIPFNIEIQGGEPTQHPDIYSVLEALNKNSRCQKMELITNLAKPVPFYKKFDQERYNKLEIVPSYHPEYDNGTYIEKVIELNEFDIISVCPNINLSDDSKYWEQTMQLMDNLKDQNIKFGTNMLFSVDGWVPNYPENFTQRFKDYRESTLTDLCKIPYITTSGEQHEFTDDEIYSHSLQRFEGFYCTPLHWCISPGGEISNSCTGAQLHALATNINCRVKCPVSDGCLECEKYSFYKNRNE